MIIHFVVTHAEWLVVAVIAVNVLGGIASLASPNR